MQSITINADIGEGYGGVEVADDEAMFAVVQAVNIACGFHGGDPTTMHRLVGAAHAADISIGAHPGFDDVEGKGRRQVEVAADRLEYMIAYQIGALQGFCLYHGARLNHVKAHGALYNMAAKRADYARAIAAAIAKIDGTLKLVGLPNSAMTDAAQDHGLVYVNEVFADRAYDNNGHLVPRDQPGAVLHDPKTIAERALRMVQTGKIRTIDGKDIDVPVDTICVHGDTPEAVAISKAIHHVFVEKDITLQGL